MVKNDEFAEAPQTTSSSDESGTSPPSPGHTDDEASDEEGGQTQLAFDDEKMNATTGWTRQDGFIRRFHWATFPLKSHTPMALAP